MKVFKKFLCITISLVLFLMVSSCFGCQKNYELVECGDFICIRYKNNNYNDQLTYFELSNVGKQKENLEISEYLKNRRIIFTRSLVKMINPKGTPGRDYPNHVFYLESQNLKKIYISARNIDFSHTFDILIDIISKSVYDEKVPNLQKIIFGTNIAFCKWTDRNVNIKTVVNDFVFKEAFESYYNRNEHGSMKYCYVNYFEIGQFKKANLQFMHNYENAPNEGYYWVDDIENGEKIEVMPTNPTREGYTFGGWYADKECLTEFDFEQTFKNGDYTPWTYPDNFTTYVYAKWVEN